MANKQSIANNPHTDNQRRWLEHFHTANLAGQTLKKYAAQHGLSLCALYNGHSILKNRGYLANNLPKR